MRSTTALKLDLKAPEKFGNVAAKLGVDERRTLAQDLLELIGIDETSMAEWMTEAKGFLDELEDKGDPKPQDREQDGSGEGDPPSTEMTLAAIIQFSAGASDALLGEPDLCSASEDDDQAVALAAWISSQVRTKDPNWILETDPLIVHMSATGLAWRKRGFDDQDEAFHSRFVPCTHIIVNANAKSVERMPRITEDFTRYPYEIDRSIRRGKWVDYEPVYDDNDPQAEKSFYECDCWLDLDGDGIDEPWTVVISRDDHPEVVKIAPRWSKNTIVDTDERLDFNPIHRCYAYKFLPDPKGGFLPMGFGKLLKRVQGSADQLLTAIVDTAKSAAEDGGVLAGGGAGLPDKVELKRNRVNTIQTDGRSLTDMYNPFPTKQVSAASVQVLEKIMTLGDRLAGTLNLLENAPASMTATMAKGIIDTGSKVQGAVHRRLVASMTGEFKQFARMADAYDQLPDGLTGSSADGVAVTADPQLATEMARSGLAGIYMELMKDPLTKWDEVRMRLYKVLRLPQPQKLLGSPPQPEATPHEKMQGMIGLLKQRTENIKVIGAVAQQLTQSLLNMVQAAGGMQDQRLAMLQMAQIEMAVKNMMEQSADVRSTIDGMVNPPSDQSTLALPPPQTGQNGSALSSGQPGGGTGAGQSGSPVGA